MELERYDVFLSSVETGFTTENTVLVKVELSDNEEQAYIQARQSKFFQDALLKINRVQCFVLVKKESFGIKDMLRNKIHRFKC